MLKKLFLWITIISLYFASSIAVYAQEVDTAPETGYAPINELELYYEIYGEGDPLILLHGGVTATEIFAGLIPTLAENRQVIAVHLQGHGHTIDIDRPFSIEAMADDIADLIEHLNIEQADVMGYSLGGMVALQTAIRHPEVVQRLVLVSVSFEREGSYPEVLAAFEQMGPETAQFMEQSPLYEMYPEVDWASLFTKLGELMRQDFDWSAEVAQLSMPTLLVFADADSIQTTHIMEFYGLLGGGQGDADQDGSRRPLTRLAILPDTTHYNVYMSPYLGPIVTQFLDLQLQQAE